MKTEKPIAIQIVDFIRSEKLEAGSHLPAQRLADLLHVSRSPINEALKLLHEKGILRREANRGYFVAQPLQQPTSVLTEQLGLSESSIVTQAYLRIADDLLDGQLPAEFSETLLKNRYDLTNSQLQSVLSRIRQEGWAIKKPGYGWVFSTMLTTPDSLLQSYRLRLVVEPAALLEPGYRLDPTVLARCREAEMLLLQGGIETDGTDQLHERGVEFHEVLVEASGNPFFIDTIRRLNRVRRLLSYRTIKNRDHIREQCLQHLHVLELLEKGRNREASRELRKHLVTTLNRIKRISTTLR